MGRHRTFSSSKIHNLTSFGRGTDSLENTGSGFDTYIEEKAFEINLDKPINSEHNARPTSWGHLVEKVAFDRLGLDFKLVSKDRFYHKMFIKYWSGMPDLITDELVGDIKCPWTLKSFCTVVKSINIYNKTGDLSLFKKNHKDWYWQLVSNAILCDRDKAIFVVYCPYLEDLKDIRELAEESLGDGTNKYAFITWAEDEELPYLKKSGKYNDINAMEFDIPQEDMDFLTARVKMAIKDLQKQI